MIYSQYKCLRRAYIGGKLYEMGEVVNYFPSLEKYKSFKGIGDPIQEEPQEELNEPEEQQGEIKRMFGGKWQLPDGEIITGKRADAEAALQAKKV